MAGSKSLRGIVVLIASSGGRVETRIKIQKEAFLLAASNAGGFQVNSFNYHHYGPYSREISDVLQFAVSSDLITEEKEDRAGNGVEYAYAITSKGRDYLTEAGEPKDEEARLMGIMHKYHWRVLELAATARFVEITSKIKDRTQALGEAVRLKPDTDLYRLEAEELLSRLDTELVGHA